METKRARLLLADDHQILCDGLRVLLSSEPDIEVVGRVGTGYDALRCVGSLKADIVMMDLCMPQTNGVEAIANIKRRFPETKSIVLTFHKAEEYVRAAFDAGAVGYVLKDDGQDQLLVALRSVMSGKTYLSAGVCREVVTGYLKTFKNNGGIRKSWEILSHREREVIKLIAEGYRNREIAEYLSLSPKTVEKHRATAMQKLRLHNIAGITAYAIENGLAVIHQDNSVRDRKRLSRYTPG
ncbi:MAG: response regulator transcription factor [Gammaproteobacteria bacterium]|nr:response regulator transcription factor [Gammaproteobacteria bacterium]